MCGSLGLCFLCITSAPHVPRGSVLNSCVQWVCLLSCCFWRTDPGGQSSPCGVKMWLGDRVVQEERHSSRLIRNNGEVPSGGGSCKISGAGLVLRHKHRGQFLWEKNQHPDQKREAEGGHRAAPAGYLNVLKGRSGWEGLPGLKATDEWTKSKVNCFLFLLPQKTLAAAREKEKCFQLWVLPPLKQERVSLGRNARDLFPPWFHMATSLRERHFSSEGLIMPNLIRWLSNLFKSLAT